MKKNVLIVDDESHILELLRYNLEANGYQVTSAMSGEEALEILDEKKIDLVILDYMMPGIDGIETLSHIRRLKGSRVPVIMLTAKNEEIDAVLGLEMGADDYIGKPFRVRELLSRVKAVLRRTEPVIVAKGTPENCPIRLDETTFQVFKNDKEIGLTLKEFELLAKLMEHPGKVYTREALLERIWGYDFAGESRTVDVHIRQLRKKIEDDDKKPHFILTVRGMGYKFNGKG